MIAARPPPPGPSLQSLVYPPYFLSFLPFLLSFLLWLEFNNTDWDAWSVHAVEGSTCLLFEVYTSVQGLIKAPRTSQFAGSVKGLNTRSAPCPAPQGVSQPPSISTCIYQQSRKSKRSPRVSRRWHPNAQHHLQSPDILFFLAFLSFIRLLWLSAGGHRACTWLTSGSVFHPRQHRAVWSSVNHFSNIITSSSQKSKRI